MWGAIIGAGASLIGGALNRKSQKDQYKRERNDAISDQINKLPRLRESAEKAGFNPLTALMSTGGGGFGQTGVSMGAAPLSSAAILTNAVAGIADAWTDKRAADANRAKVEGEIWRRQIEKERAGGAGETIRRTVQRAGVADLGNRASEGSPTSVKTGLSGPFDLWNVLPSVGGPAAVELTMPENVTREHIGPLHQSMTRRDGSRIEIPVGPDIDEVLMGAALDKGPELYNRAENFAKGSWMLTMPSLTPNAVQAGRHQTKAIQQWFDDDPMGSIAETVDKINRIGQKEKPKRLGPYPDQRSKTARRKYMRREEPYVRN